MRSRYPARLSRIWSADLCQMKGLGFSFQLATHISTERIRSGTLWCVDGQRFRQGLTGQRFCPSMKELTLHQQEQARLQVLNSVLAEEITIGQAAALMELSERHVRRLLAAYREVGAEALAHGNRGRRPHNAVPEAVAAAVARLAATRYPGANHTHLTELLEEHEGLALSRPTVRRILTRAGMPSPRRRRPPQHRVRRERMPRAGMLLQLDGSHHAWLEQRGPRFALLLAVDDATGAVVHALFGAVEDARGYFLLMEGVLRRSGVPLALYTDRHAVFRAPAQQRAGREGATQFARAMAELGVRLIFARSPQAKGRVERMAGTFQDRLVTELRLASASTIAEAQAVLERFLPRFNARFAVAARQREPGLAPARLHARPRRRPRLPAHPHRRARQHRQVPLAHAAAAALAAAAQLRRRARRGAGAPRRRTRGAPPGRDHPCAARPAPRRCAARAALRAGARPCTGAHRLGPRPQWRSTPPAGAPGYDQRHDRQRRCAHRPALADREAGGALEGDSTGPPAGTLDARHRPAARHLTQHHQEVRPRRRPTRAPGCGIIYRAATTQTDIFAEPLTGQSR